MTDEVNHWADEMKARRMAMLRPPTPKKRRGKTPEALVTAECQRYLKQIGALVLRTGAGLTEIDGRKITIGRAGSSDDTALLPNGAWCSLEYKSERGQLSDLQRRYQADVVGRNGLYIVARSASDVRMALIARFGEATIRQWEN